MFGHLLRRVRVQAHVSTATASLAIGPGHRQRLADLEEGRLVATEAVLTRLERAYGCGSGVLLSVFRELEEFPDGSAYRKLAKAVSDAEDSEPVHVTTAIDGPARSIPSRLTALVTDNLLVSAVVPSAAGFATGVALPLLLGAPGSEVGLSHLTSTFGKESGLAVVGIVWVALAVLFDAPIGRTAEAIRRRVPALQRVERAIDDALIRAGLSWSIPDPSSEGSQPAVPSAGLPVFSLPSLEPIPSAFQSTTLAVIAFAISDDGSQLALAGADPAGKQRVRVVRRSDGSQVIATEVDDPGTVNVDFAPDGTSLLLSDAFGALSTIGLASGHIAHEVYHGMRAKGYGYHGGTGTRVIAAGTDGTARQWDATTAEAIGDPIVGDTTSLLGADDQPIALADTTDPTSLLSQRTGCSCGTSTLRPGRPWHASGRAAT